MNNHHEQWTWEEVGRKLRHNHPELWEAFLALFQEYYSPGPTGMSSLAWKQWERQLPGSIQRLVIEVAVKLYGSGSGTAEAKAKADRCGKPGGVYAKYASRGCDRVLETSVLSKFLGRRGPTGDGAKF